MRIVLGEQHAFTLVLLGSVEGLTAIMSAQMNLAISVTDDEVERPEQQALWLRIVGRDWVAPVVLILVCLFLYQPGLPVVPPLDRDEARFAQASKQMMETGNYVSIYFQEVARNKKPIGIYWAQVGAAKLLGYNEQAPIWVYRLPSAFGAIAAVLLTYWAGRAFYREQQAFLAALFVALALVLNAEAHLATADAALLACVMLAQGALARVWLAQQSHALWGPALLFWLGLALGTLIKGPSFLWYAVLPCCLYVFGKGRLRGCGGLLPSSVFWRFYPLRHLGSLQSTLKRMVRFSMRLWVETFGRRLRSGANPTVHLHLHIYLSVLLFSGRSPLFLLQVFI